MTHHTRLIKIHLATGKNHITGADTMFGNDGNDVLDGGPGGDDVLLGGTGFDTFIFADGAGTDQRLGEILLSAQQTIPLSNAGVREVLETFPQC